MSLYDDVVQEILDSAGKANDSVNVSVARGAVDRTLDDLNRSMDSEFVEETDHTTAITALQKEIDLPEAAKTVIELGVWNTVTEAIYVPWTEITQRGFHLRGGGAGDVADTGTPKDEWREFFFVDYGQGSQSGGFRLRIRPVPALSESATLAVRYYTSLTSANCERVGRDILFAGAVCRIPRWFPDALALYDRNYKLGKQTLKKKHASLMHPIHMGVHPMVRRNNAWQRRLNG